MSTAAFGSDWTLMPRSFATSCAHWVGDIDVGAAGGAGLGAGCFWTGVPPGGSDGILRVPLGQPRRHEPGAEREVRWLVGERAGHVDHLLDFLAVVGAEVTPAVVAGLLERLVGGVVDGEVVPSFDDVERHLILGGVGDRVAYQGWHAVVEQLQGAALGWDRVYLQREQVAAGAARVAAGNPELRVRRRVLLVGAPYLVHLLLVRRDQRVRLVDRTERYELDPLYADDVGGQRVCGGRLARQRRVRLHLDGRVEREEILGAAGHVTQARVDPRCQQIGRAHV